jgi:DNA invertase Pin-like site-specific DNA recombinase/DNA-binding CsgD family transcriptional regulator
MRIGKDTDRLSEPGAAVSLTARQAELLRLCARGLSGKQIARRLGISARTVEAHFRGMLRRTGASSRSELVAYAAAVGMLQDDLGVVPVTVVSGTDDMLVRLEGGDSPGNQSRNRTLRRLPDAMRAEQVSGSPGSDDGIRIGYARVNPLARDQQTQLGALATAHCREIVVETASTRAAWPKLASTLAALRPGDTLVIHKPDRVARTMKELVALLDDQLHARSINLHILTGVCAGLHRPNGATAADTMLFTMAAMVAEIERGLIRERTMDGLRAAQAQGRRGGRPAAVSSDLLAVARTRRERGEPVTAIARHLGVGRSTLYRALANPLLG